MTKFPFTTAYCFGSVSESNEQTHELPLHIINKNQCRVPLDFMKTTYVYSRATKGICHFEYLPPDMPRCHPSRGRRYLLLQLHLTFSNMICSLESPAVANKCTRMNECAKYGNQEIRMAKAYSHVAINDATANANELE